ncbi:MAG: glycogen debranching protein GlgX [Rubrivivax sp.]|nr:glycogen debranching protein GlgX [Rubrivivax sp.]
MTDVKVAPAALPLTPGRAWPLGASCRDGGVNFAVFSEHATAIELCLFDADGGAERSRTALPARSGDVWHGFVPGAGAGLVYGLRAWGPWQPERGQRFNPHKLLLDPWAREIVGAFDWQGPHCGAERGQPLQIDRADNAAQALKARVIDDDFDWQGDQAPRTPLAGSVVCELHVGSFTRQMQAVPEALRGSYAGLTSDPALAHLKRLGVTALSLLPVHQRIDEQRLVAAGLRNHWGYNTVGFFCPEPRYGSAGSGRALRDEFRRMVQRLHGAGIEVILDVVFNHTAETDEFGPTIAWRGLDNTSWYRLPAENPFAYENHSGCGNTLDIRHPRVLQFVMDSLRYWVQAMHVDGFRFDLAPVLGRGNHGFERDGAFFQALAQDPVLAEVKLIAEPWDIGPGGYQLGNFPHGWLEWNDRFRDTMRRFWLGGAATRGEFAQRLCASSDWFQPRRRQPAESLNFVVAHDGFTLADLVSHDHRHNEANLEGNRDGHGDNHSWNCGVEGPTTDPAVLALRARLQRALLATLLLAQGTPMLAAGDEIGHSQGGNNNAYCQDNATSWLDWSVADTALSDFTARVIALRRRWLPLANRWYDGLADDDGRSDLAWLGADGAALTAADWADPGQRVLGALIGPPGHGQARWLLLVNAEAADIGFALPAGNWQAELDSSQADGASGWRRGDAWHCPLPARSVMLLRDAASA